MKSWLRCWDECANYTGRACRAEFWNWLICNVLVMPGIATGVISCTTRDTNLWLNLIVGLYILTAAIPSLALSARRLHDTGKSGWIVLIGAIPIFGTLVLLIFLAFQGGDSGRNHYGEVPKCVGRGLFNDWLFGSGKGRFGIFLYCFFNLIVIGNYFQNERSWQLSDVYVDGGVRIVNRTNCDIGSITIAERRSVNVCRQKGKLVAFGTLVSAGSTAYLYGEGVADDEREKLRDYSFKCRYETKNEKGDVVVRSRETKPLNKDEGGMEIEPGGTIYIQMKNGKLIHTTQEISD